MVKSESFRFTACLGVLTSLLLKAGAGLVRLIRLRLAPPLTCRACARVATDPGSSRRAGRGAVIKDDVAGGPIARRLAAVLVADMVGYTRQVERDSQATVLAWRAARAHVIAPQIAAHSGRLVKYTGDGFLGEFPSVQDAVTCAVAMQEGLTTSPLAFRMGLDLGDIIDDGEDIHGEAVNVAARLEALADPGGICVSGEIRALVRNRIGTSFEDLGEQRLKHVSTAVRVFALRASADAPAREAGSSSRSPIAVLPFPDLTAERKRWRRLPSIASPDVHGFEQDGFAMVRDAGSCRLFLPGRMLPDALQRRPIQLEKARGR